MAETKIGLGLVAGVVSGTILEWYDTFLFAVAASYIGSAFFPSKNPVTELANVFLTFALGFFARPLGAIFFGWLGDRYGRRTAMFWTLATAGIATALIGVVPPYSDLGALAVAIVVLLRVLQGFALGGEWGTAVNYLFENVKRKRLFMAFVQSGVPLGLLFAAGVLLALTAALGNAAVSAWGWRAAFLLSLLLVVIGLFFRFKFGETLEYLEARRRAEKVENPIAVAYGKYWKELVVGIFLAGAAGAVFYYGNAFLPNLAGALKLVTAQAKFEAVVLFALLDLIGIIISGFLAERMGNLLPITLGFILFIIGALLITYALSNAAVFFVVVLLTGFAHGIVYTPEAAFLAELFPTLARATGVSSAYQIGNTVLAGTAPYIMTVIVGVDKFLGGVYLASLAVLGLAGVLAYGLRARR
ncbi:MFS transporter [Thermoproteus tenax]|uniref:Permease of the major facilitator superfamily n=1 Tax=Thermoproteus tenax (strain ATCC 35583 / DSM 2078 / JCM 9277 / NBRC 100435 / Kra 1) TaxID=768679 RepID=G4RKC1_THETK|nr:MFS transporter [Thermoproteus tenax]CCC82016.1 permease of the major facilitator superfamily [Thermoproteus tenax Kra 1]